MTTIAYRDGIIAADTQLTVGDMRFISDPKIVTLSNGVVFAAAGTASKISRAIKFFSDPRWEEREDIPDIKKGFEAIIVSKGRVYYCSDDFIVTPLVHPFWAIGSGSHLAYAALHLGRSAEEAIKFAGELNIYTNNQVQIVNVQNLLYEEAPKRARRTIKRKAVSEA